MIYDWLLLAAVILLATALSTAIGLLLPSPLVRPLTQVFVLGASLMYYGWHWTARGQTLPMRTWRIRLVDRRGSSPSWPLAFARMALATAGFLLCGITLFWALFDSRGQFLHDRLLGTALVPEKKTDNA